MIHSDIEMETTQERIAYFQRILADLRQTARPEEFPYVASGYRVEIEKMHAEILEYLMRHSSEPTPSEAV